MIFQLYKNEKTIYKMITMAVILAALFFVCKMVYAGIISLPYPKEFLEPSNVALTNTFLSGKSPYTLSALNWETPGINYDYPFFNSLLAAGVAIVFCCNAVQAHFIVSLTSIILSGVLGAFFVSRYAKTTVGPALAAILFMFCHWRFGYISAAPDDLGLLLFLITSYMAVCPKIRNKPLCCAIGVTICFYTKQYFVLIAVCIFIYMLMYSWKEAVRFLICCVLINTLTAIGISIFWPLYWTKAFLFTYIGTVIGGGGQIATFFYQIKYIIVMFAALFAVVIFAAVRSLRKLYQSSKRIQNIKLRENSMFELSAVSAIVMIIPLLYLGRNDGALFSYFLQLWMPFVVIVGLVCFERVLPDDKPDSEPEDIDKSKETVHRYLFYVIYVLLASSTIYFGFGKLPLHILTEQEISDWKKAYEYTRIYSEKGDIFYSRGLAYEGFKRGNGQWMCGHEGEPTRGNEHLLKVAGLTQEEYPYIHLIVEQNEMFREKVSDKARDHEYSLITFETDDAFIPFDEEYCEEIGYRCIDRLNLQFGNMPYEVAFYALQ